MAPLSLKSSLFLLAGTCLYLVPSVRSVTSYANVFYNPDVLAAGDFNQSTLNAQSTIIQWAGILASQGPWTVTSKEMAPPSGDKHDYMSFSPYAWPDCSKAGNTTELTPEQIWTTCEYVTRDGQFNPDARMVNDIGNFDDMADAVFYNSLAWIIGGDLEYSTNAVNFIQSWFLSPDTGMNPNLNYAQMKRGPGGRNGTHTGVLDLKCLTKVVNGVLILRDKKAPAWTADLDGKMIAWAKEYITWLQTASIAQEEEASTNNHGSFYFNQLGALQLLIGDKDAVQKAVQVYFSGIYAGQISANGDQPFESARTRPYHYRAYNLAAMITNARIGEYAGINVWNTTTSSGTTIQSALDFAIAQQPGNDDPSELYPHVAAVAMQYGDPQGKYGTFLRSKLNVDLTKAPFYLWDSLSVEGIATPTSNDISTPTSSHAGRVKPTAKSEGSSTGKEDSSALSDFAVSKLLYGAIVTVSAVSRYFISDLNLTFPWSFSILTATMFADELKTFRRLGLRYVLLQILNFASVLASGLMMWKGLGLFTNTESPIVVVLSGSMEPAFYRGDLLFLTNPLNERYVTGDITVYKVPGADIPIVHRVLETHDVPPKQKRGSPGVEATVIDEGRQ
ncbi:hypothetical protein EUX98_g2369 [Antrodiella citrinella]|uniref:Signal peptidase complex catalytic subunit SEC11 n=1 Tax=Antrodiella citrinella TaxID=2447956 RepID=A0A4S4N0K2_9APHY|nr:hypothetical protein EUX98_g2369 [Antrodiella citrinella]